MRGSDAALTRALRLFAVAILLLASCKSIVRERLEAPKLIGDGTGYVFTIDEISASEVHLAGDFNHWGPNDNGRIRKGDRFNIPYKQRPDGIWEVTVPYRENVNLPQYDHLSDDVYLEHGKRYIYKIVFDGGNRWITDPTNRSIERDPSGNENSILVAP